MDTSFVRATLEDRLEDARVAILDIRQIHVEWQQLYGVIRETDDQYLITVDDRDTNTISGVLDALVISNVSDKSVDPGATLAQFMMDYSNGELAQKLS